LEETGEPYDYADKFKAFSKKVRLLSGVSKIEKEKLTQIYRIKKILKMCSLPLEDYKKTKSFNSKDNFREDKITTEEMIISVILVVGGNKTPTKNDNSDLVRTKTKEIASLEQKLSSKNIKKDDLLKELKDSQYLEAGATN
ncbi:16334_t:CDS:2, partial [Funneliformis geosporum]